MAQVLTDFDTVYEILLRKPLRDQSGFVYQLSTVVELELKNPSTPNCMFAKWKLLIDVYIHGFEHLKFLLNNSSPFISIWTLHCFKVICRWNFEILSETDCRVFHETMGDVLWRRSEVAAKLNKRLELRACEARRTEWELQEEELQEE
ncbi:hypothetical protein JR316_0009691 [Psilocybe cubensis]|uniref:Uncharacterized protein n=1 Tax=Psilocybe cubensis TaxID=181762 RepID=A0ACB8GP00_PSICU|nr:hypothetical protein JR316_0009691 [Psilocybe cubensis]KAH9477475.1 hypothetical protein JR316_0009691 [Psilocybe cubensis]